MQPINSVLIEAAAGISGVIIGWPPIIKPPPRPTYRTTLMYVVIGIVGGILGGNVIEYAFDDNSLASILVTAIIFGVILKFLAGLLGMFDDKAH